MRSQPRDLPKRLAELFSLGLVRLSDERAAEYDRDKREFETSEGRHKRRDRLKSIDIELVRHVHEAIVASPDLKPHPESPGTSLLAVKRWLRRDDLAPTLILVGQNGCGKSCAAAYACANFPGTEFWVSAEDLGRTYADYSDDAKRARRRIRRAELLVIDDVCTELDQVRVCAALVEALEHRKQRRTIITTNITPDGWKERFPDPRLHSRLKDAEFVPDHGPDLRGTT